VSCARLEALLPYAGKILHACWSGEACWAPLAPVWSSGSVLPPENATANPAPGEVLLFAGELSEPELLFPYGACHFASRAGPLVGNPVLSIEGDHGRLAEVGREMLWSGAMDLRIEPVAAGEQSLHEPGWISPAARSQRASRPRSATRSAGRTTAA
jgi:hypothetical protein